MVGYRSASLLTLCLLLCILPACSQSENCSADCSIGDAALCRDGPGGFDGTDGSDGSTEARVPFADIHAAFVTPNAAMIRWWPERGFLRFGRYELWYGRDREAVLQARWCLAQPLLVPATT